MASGNQLTNGSLNLGYNYIKNHGYQCNSCHNNYASVSAFEAHITNHRNTQSNTPYQLCSQTGLFGCTVCGLYYKKKQSLKSHHLRHEWCPDCKRGFLTKWNLYDHWNVKLDCRNQWISGEVHTTQ